MSFDNHAPVFLDFEASGLAPDCYPIEVGWASFDTAGAVVSEAMLIKPSEEWILHGSWDPIAEKDFHRISLDDLWQHGRDPIDVARRMNAALAGRTLHSDSISDVGWMSALFEAANERMNFQIAGRRSDYLVIELADRYGVGAISFKAAELEATRLAPRTHRAEADARYWATLWNLVRNGYRASAAMMAALLPPRMLP